MSLLAQRKTLAAQAEPMKALEKLIRESAYRHPLHTVFADFVEMSALAISNAVDLCQREKREARYLEIVKRYNAEEAARFPQMLGCLVMALEGEMRDHLGRLFMAIELGNHWVGQFFTPYELCVLMAKMQLHDAAELIEAKGFITMCEPAAGAGAMVIACAQALRDAEINYQQTLHVTAQDLDSTAAQMCYLQMSLLGIPGVVVVGDTLRMEERERWYTPAHIVDGWAWKLRARAEVLEGTEVNGDPADLEEVPPSAAVPPAVESVGLVSAGSGSGTCETGQLDLFGGAA